MLTNYKSKSKLALTAETVSIVPDSLAVAHPTYILANTVRRSSGSIFQALV